MKADWLSIYSSVGLLPWHDLCETIRNTRCLSLCLIIKSFVQLADMAVAVFRLGTSWHKLNNVYLPVLWRYSAGMGGVAIPRNLGIPNQTPSLC